MINNERQYRITRAQAGKVEEALTNWVRQPPADLDPLLRKSYEDALRSQLEDLREEMRQYEALRLQEPRLLGLEELEDLPQALINARIAAGLTQRELAELLNLKEQQIQRYEATEYASASLGRVQRIAKVLCDRVRERSGRYAASSPDQGGRADGENGVKA
ncbi:MAG: helix-turn-helix transcriptional regulator [Firmicutes bacterium]|nr:helix-turn-helix transcriptional regulator [Bacillota bacterium]